MGAAGLRQKAAAADTAFLAACNLRMAQTNAAKDPKEPLFHYTKEQALYDILDSGLFRFTSIYHMDDTEELNFGFEVASEMFKEASQRIRGGLEHNFCSALGVDGDRDKIRAMIEFYSVSFGLKDVSRQWIKYADEGKGVALGLAPDFFRIPIEDPDNPKPEEMIFPGKVTYGLEDGRARHQKVVDAALVVMEQVQRRGWLGSSHEAGVFCAHLAASMYTEILWNCVTTKKCCWSYQNEMRLLARNFLKDPTYPIVNPQRPRVEIIQPRLKDNIVEVMVGPKADAGAVKRVREGLATRDLGRVPVTQAKAQ
jgi:hypothetical protein